MRRKAGVELREGGVSLIPPKATVPRGSTSGAPLLAQAQLGPETHGPWLLDPQVVLPTWLSSTKFSSLIERISDPKDLKKLLRTRNNVLVLYSKSGECPSWPWGHRQGCGGMERKERGQKWEAETPGLKTAQGRSIRRCRGVSSAAFGSLRGRFSFLLPVFLRKSPLESLSTSGGRGRVCEGGQRTVTTRHGRSGSLDSTASPARACFARAVDSLTGPTCRQLNWSQAWGHAPRLAALALPGPSLSRSGVRTRD